MTANIEIGYDEDGIPFVEIDLAEELLWSDWKDYPSKVYLYLDKDEIEYLYLELGTALGKIG